MGEMLVIVFSSIGVPTVRGPTLNDVNDHQPFIDFSSSSGHPDH